MLILANAKIYTQDPKQPQAEALAIQTAPENGGRVMASGSLDTLRAEFPSAKVEDLDGKVVLPGLTDAHVHIRNYAHGLNSLACDTTTRAECLERVRQRAAATSPGAWIRGHGWRQINWPEGFGTAELLDKVAPRNPVYLTTASLHAGWANSAALRAAGITAETADPPSGQIQRDENGQPTGILFEEAQGLVEDAIPHPSAEEDIAAIQAAQSRLWSYGLTGVHDFDRLRSFAALQTMRSRGELKLRVHKNLPVEALEHAIGIGLRSGFGDDLLRIGGIKAFADGALGPRTAAMVEPYAGEPNNRGMLFLDSEQLFERAQMAARGGLKMTVHAIGDRANHEVLNAYEQLRAFERSEGLPALRHRIEHVQLLHPDDLQRLGKLNIIASMQPIHATSDMDAAEQYWGDRSQFAYAWRTQLEAGAMLAFGSDAPVESPNPWLGIHAAVTRRRADGTPGVNGWYPQQRLTLTEALAGFTTGPAYASGMESKLGRLGPCYLADLIVMEQDPLSIDAHELRHLLPRAVMLGGEWVLRS
jgi:predicted amidohydrolase YtcJ